MEGIGKGVEDEGFHSGKMIQEKRCCGRNGSTDVRKTTQVPDKDLEMHLRRKIVRNSGRSSYHRRISTLRETRQDELVSDRAAMGRKTTIPKR